MSAPTLSVVGVRGRLPLDRARIVDATTGERLMDGATAARVIEGALALVPPARAAVSPAVIEELYRKAAILNHGLFGMMMKLEQDHTLCADEDLFPFWELSTTLLVRLRGLNEGHEQAQGATRTPMARGE